MTIRVTEYSKRVRGGQEWGAKIYAGRKLKFTVAFVSPGFSSQSVKQQAQMEIIRQIEKMLTDEDVLVLDEGLACNRQLTILRDFCQTVQ